MLWSKTSGGIINQPETCPRQSCYILATFHPRFWHSDNLPMLKTAYYHVSSNLSGLHNLITMLFSGMNTQLHEAAPHAPTITSDILNSRIFSSAESFCGSTYIIWYFSNMGIS